MTRGIAAAIVACLLACAPSQPPPAQPLEAPPGVTVPSSPRVPPPLPPRAQPAVPLAYPMRLAVSGGATCTSDFEADAVICAAPAGSPFARLVLRGVEGPLGLAIRGTSLLVGSSKRGSVDVYDAATGRLVSSLGRGAGEVSMPSAIAVAADGTVFVADSRADVVKVYGAAGALERTIGGPGTTDGLLRFPSALALKGQQLIVGDQGNHRLQVFGVEGQWQRTVGEAVPMSATSRAAFAGRFTRIQGLAVRGEATLVLDSYHSHVQVFDKDFVSQGFFGRQGDCQDCLRLALDVAVGANDEVLVADPEHRRITTLPFAPR